MVIIAVYNPQSTPRRTLAELHRPPARSGLLFSMQRLAQETCDLIALYIESQSQASSAHTLSALAATSRIWQKAVERTTFRDLKLSSTDLGDFEKIVTGARRTYVRLVRYAIILPPYSTDLRQTFERPRDRDANDEACNEAIHGLLQTLRSWEQADDFERRGSITLELSDISSPTDHQPQYPWYQMSQEEDETMYGPLGMRHLYSYVTLPESAQFPLVRSIRRLVYRSPKPYARKLSSQAFIEIASKLPCVTEVRGDFTFNEWSYPTIRRRNRDDTTRAIQQHSLPESARDLSLVLDTWMIWNQTWQPPNLLQAGIDHDPLGSEVWNATRDKEHLTSLHVAGVIDSNVMWPSSIRTSIPFKPFWQSLRSLRINFDLATPSGEWYFCAGDGPQGGAPQDHGTSTAPLETARPPGYESTEAEDESAALRFSLSDKGEFCRDAVLFRLVPNEPVLEPLIESFARACGQIPSLEDARLETLLYEGLEVDGATSKCKSDWGIYYAAPHYSLRWSERVKGSCVPQEDIPGQCITLNTRGWRPNDGLLCLLRDISN